MSKWTLEDVYLAACGAAIVLTCITLIGCLCYAVIQIVSCRGHG